MFSPRLIAVSITSLMVATLGCTVNADLGTGTLFPTGASFVISGTADAVASDTGTCVVWLGDNGVTYHLFQSSRIANEDFDRITTPGVTSRLEIAPRSDLVVDCQVGSIVEVQDVLEIVS